MFDNLEGIDTVQDLMRIQKGKPATTKELVDELVKPIFDETPGIGMECIDYLVAGMIELHQHMIDAIKENGDDRDLAASWQRDLSKLEIAQELLDSIRI